MKTTDQVPRDDNDKDMNIDKDNNMAIDNENNMDINKNNNMAIDKNSAWRNRNNAYDASLVILTSSQPFTCLIIFSLSSMAE